jgi:transcriptional regulator with XRE-family HTH domain
VSHVDPRFGVHLRALRTSRGLSLRALGQLAHRGKSHLHDLETGAKAPTPATARHLDEVLRASGTPARLVDQPVDHDAEAGELLARVRASDVSAETLARIEAGVDDLASAYATTRPEAAAFREVYEAHRRALTVEAPAASGYPQVLL